MNKSVFGLISGNQEENEKSTGERKTAEWKIEFDGRSTIAFRYKSGEGNIVAALNPMKKISISSPFEGGRG
ncbi:hypothetical protein [Rufibacter sp. DG15C]|uniref:hypothetical protein n=1 Tax=Rufibacter sp. DG15C TaxID=1379909 RepID=UPI0012F737C4|nr:hypothetical protein [Rufibacter sp. DG15C]